MLQRCLCLVALLLLASCGTTSQAPEEKVQREAVTFSDLPGWQDDAVEQAIPALSKSCAINKKPEWQEACLVLKQNTPQNNTDARAYFEKYFTPYAVTNGGGLFTGYYEAELRGSLTQTGAYQTPLWSRPDDMIAVDLGLFKPELKGQKITGKVDGHALVPYDTRAQIAAVGLDGRAKPLLFVDDPVDAFFLEIQGSGRVKLSDGSILRVGYDGQNGRAYVPVGRVLAERGEIEKPVTMQKIRDWMERNGPAAQEVMNQNPSSVFFKIQNKSDDQGPVGAQNVALTPMRSMAVDPSYIVLGTPLFVVMDKGPKPRLVIAQDTGGAIKGAVRGDLFMGAGAEAEALAGALQSGGTYYLLLPRAP